MDWNEIFRSVPKIDNKVNLSFFKSFWRGMRRKNFQKDY